MGRVLYATGLEISHSREHFAITFRFMAPDGYVESVYIIISPEGAVTLRDSLGKEIEGYLKEHGNIVVGSWQTGEAKNHNCNGNDKDYLS